MASRAATLEAAGSFCDIVRRHARERGGCPAFTCEGETVTFAELDANANRVANALCALGLKKGERVAFLGRNHRLYFEALLGAARIGAVMIPVNRRLAPPEIAYVLDHSCARVVFVGEGFADMLAGMRRHLPEVEQVIGIEAPDHPGTDYRIWRDGFAARPLAARIGPRDDALQLYTSGTTGRPRGAVISHGAILASQDTAGHVGSRPWRRPVAGAATLLSMPTFHISGTGAGLAAMIAGTQAIVLPEFDPAKALDLIADHTVSRLFLAPSALRILLDHPRARQVDFSRLEYIAYGASPMPLELLREAMAVMGCGFVRMYGTIETCGTIAALDPEDHLPEGSPRMRSVGTPLAGVEIRILDPEGRVLPPGEVGEIATRSARNMSRYWNDPEATAGAFDGEGWLRTGDAGHLDADGYLTLHGRVTDLILPGEAPEGSERAEMSDIWCSQ